MPDKELSLVGHLTELRKRIIYCLVPFVIVALASVSFAKYILYFLRFPARGIIEKLAYFSPQEVAIVYTKLAIYSGIVLSLPIIFYHTWKFISPALEEKYKRHIFSFIFWATLSFFAGCIFGYFGLVPVSLKFLLAIGGDELTPVISLSKYLSFVLALILGSGAVFEIPVLVWILTKLKMVNVKLLRKKRKYAVAAIFIIAAIITPTTDPFNMCLMALPMIILYEISIWVSRWNQPRSLPALPAAGRERAGRPALE